MTHRRGNSCCAAGRNDTAGAHEALENLCQTHWFPLYAYLRRRGYSPADAEDLTQGFFARLLRLDSLAERAAREGQAPVVSPGRL